MAVWKYARAFQAAFALCLAGATWVSLVEIPGPLPASDKHLHAAGYLVLGFLADFAFPSRPYLLAKVAPLLLYGVVIEGLQSRIPGRSAEAADLLANLAGLLLFWLCLPLLRRVPVLRGRWNR
jgi:VanZ family protein